MNNVYENLKEELKYRPVYTIGLIEMFVYSVMIVYIFIWTPLLLSSNSNTNFGLTFLCFTFSIIIFSKLFEIQILLGNVEYYDNFSIILLINAFFLLIPFYIDNFKVKLFCFTIVNGTFGYLMPSLSAFKSKLLNEKYRTLLMSVYKVPTYFLSILTLIFSILISIEKVRTF